MKHKTNSLSERRADLKDRWVKENLLKFEKVTVGSRAEVKWICNNEHIFVAQIKRTASQKKLNCPECKNSNSIEMRYPELSKAFSKDRNMFPFKNLLSESTPVWWILNCGHETKRTVHSIIKNKTCYKCNPEDLRKSKAINKYPEIEEFWIAGMNIIEFKEVSSWDESKYWWTCERNHKELKTVYQKAVTSINCRLCKTGALSDYNFNRTFVKLNTLKLKIDLNQTSAKSKMKIDWICKNGHQFSYEIKSQIIKDFKYCPKCTEFSVSFLEKQIRSLMKNSYNGELLFNYRDIPEVFEVDIYLPELKVAFDVNGEYWHSDKFAIQNGWESIEQKHLNKIQKCSESEIELFYIWEDDFKHNEELLAEEILKVLTLENIAEDSKSSFLRRLTSNRDRG